MNEICKVSELIETLKNLPADYYIFGNMGAAKTKEEAKTNQDELNSIPKQLKYMTQLLEAFNN